MKIDFCVYKYIEELPTLSEYLASTFHMKSKIHRNNKRLEK